MDELADEETIDGLNKRGEGLADARVVPLALPGERVRWDGQRLTILTASPDRATTDLPLFRGLRRLRGAAYEPAALFRVEARLARRGARAGRSSRPKSAP